MDVLNLIAKESYAIIKSFTISQNFYLTASDQSNNAHDAEAPAILLVPGYMCKPGCFNELYKVLVESGYRVFIYRPKAYTISIKQHSKSLAEFIRKIKKQYPIDSLTILGYSMGGLIARDTMALKWDTEFNFVNRVITVATPHNGTIMAYAGIGECVKEMVPGSVFLTILGHEDCRYRHKITCFTADLDGLVFNEKSASLSGSKVIRVNNVGHMSIVDEKAFHDKLLQELTGKV